MKCDTGAEAAPTTAPLPDDPKQWSYEVLKQFRLIFKATQQHSLWVETQCGVSSAQLWMLWELSKQPGLRVTELAKVLSIHHSTASNLLDKLAKKKLIQKERASADQRVVTVTLTAAGEALMAKAPAPPQGILQHAIFALPENALKALNEHLDMLVKEMAIKDDEATMQPINPSPKKRAMKKNG
ncbi:MarR family winged helix-turn-helix transcriptional regulator [Methylovulum psychrotolerans]|uniref:MarR family transcriptional regulator n=1 Tax=Methylovulum psychrotolerans TaxID=1704499 RepID=A0A2S5CR40_9GAMM|nr:MarR family winged helix-turn-helix transcriptional regulator [Methylovulum psychrotolerans]POZ53273.1 MarR family transcriptional regulator [Methylovulum psychrotolerans]